MTELSDAELEKLGFTLFKDFARMEYSLKAAGFHHGNDRKAEACWNAFTASVRGALEADPKITDARKYLAAHPPKEQWVRGGVLVWEEPARDANPIHDMMLSVRRARNNLFHGGKFNVGYFAPQRSTELLIHSLAILEACRRASPDVAAAYLG
jgi:hypothetical protein